jgi:hypothetical protein
VAATALVLLMSFAVSQDYMKYMKPYEESPQDLAVAKQLEAVDVALGEQRPDAAQEIEKLRAMKPKKNLLNLMRSKDPVRRALTVLGMRVLQLKRMWEDLRYLLMDSAAPVRRQVLLYVQENPKGIHVEGVQMSLSEPDPAVRVAAVGAVVKTAKKPAVAVELLRSRFKEEKDPAVQKQIKLGLTVLGAAPSSN